MSDKTRQLFVLGPEIWASISREEVEATGKAMLDAEIFNYPYDEFDVHAFGKSSDIMKWVFRMSDEDYAALKKTDHDTIVPFKFRFYDFEGRAFFYSMAMHLNGREIYLPAHSYELASRFPSVSKESADYMNDTAADSILSTLLVLLATRNIDKDVQDSPKRYKDPLSKSGIRQIRNTDYRYITTIKIGKITETVHGDGAHRGPVRPHLRRGHIRNQRIGEGRKETKKVFIAPVFVNADEKWIETQRKEYRVKI